MQLIISWVGGWHGRERCGFHGFQEAGLRLRTDNSGNRLSPSGSSLVAANLRLAGLRYVSEFPGAKRRKLPNGFTVDVEVKSTQATSARSKSHNIRSAQCFG